MTQRTAAVIGFSSYSDRGALDEGAAWLKEQGFAVTIAEQAYKRNGQNAGTIADKVAAFKAACTDPAVDIIMAACGGNGAVHLLPHLDLRSCAKPVIGFSDTTSILNAAPNGAIHGPTVERLGRDMPDIQKKQWLDIVNGAAAPIEWTQCKALRAGSATGKLYGGNLSAFQTLIGTPFMPDCRGAVLFFEDCNEELSRIDRMLGHLANTGILANAAALVFGQFINMADTGKKPYGLDMPAIIERHSEGLSCPVIMDAPFGHGNDLWSLPIGKSVTLAITDRSTHIAFS